MARSNRSLPVVLVAVVFAASVSAVAGLAPGAPARPAAADQVAPLRARAQALGEEITREQLQVAGYQQQYDEASAQLAASQAAIDRVRARLVADRQRVASTHRRLQHEALMAFVDANPQVTASASAMFATDESSNLARAEYQQLIVGDVQTTLAELHTSVHVLRANEASLVALQVRNRQAASRSATLLRQSQVTQVQLQAQQGQVTGQLAALITQVQSAQATAAVRAAASAGISRPSPPASVQVTVSPPAPPVGHATSDPPLNAFLQCVVMHESGGNYAAVSPNGQYMGAFQFSQSTWNSVARLAGFPGLVGVPPNTATKADQDTLAVALYALDGARPWYDPCRG